MELESRAVEITYWLLAVLLGVYTLLSAFPLLHGLALVVVLRVLLIGERIERNLR